MPFIDENGETDIAFVLDDEVVLLSEMEENPLFENCGWFSKAWKKFAPVAKLIVAVAVVAAVVVVAAPAVAAAVPVLASGLSISGGALALSGGTAAAAMAAAGTAATAAAATYLPVIAAATATTLAVAAVDAGIEAAKEENNSTDNTNDKKTVDDSSADHMFRDAEGHLKEDTPENRKKLEDVANDKNNFLGTDQYGNDWYAKNNPDGTQTWVQTRGNKIRNGGVNSTPRPWNPSTGLSGLNK